MYFSIHKFNYFFIFFLILYFISANHLMAQTSADAKLDDNLLFEKESKLSSVSVLDFANTKNLSQYAYLSPSISHAIKKRLSQIFTYRKTGQRKIKRAFRQILKQKKLKWHQMSLEEIKILADQKKIDIIIYGKYTVQRKKERKADELEITVNVYLSAKKVNIILGKFLSTVSTQIFIKTDKIANSLVKKIQSLLKEKTVQKKSQNDKIILDTSSVDLIAQDVSNFEQKNTLYEIGLHPFYQFILFSDSESVNSTGGGFSFYSRSSLNAFSENIFANIQLPDWLSHALFFGAGISASYISRGEDNINLLYQNYIFSFEVSYLYPVSASFRIGLSMRFGYYIGFTSDFVDASPYSGFILPVSIEINYLFYKNLGLNVGFGDDLYRIEQLISHNLNFFVGVSYAIQ